MGPDLGQQVVLLGKGFPSFNREFMEAVRKIIWFTYRSQFGQAIEGTPYMSDAGWGCMIRTGQMILGRTLLSLEKYSMPQIIEGFLDNHEAPFSLHNIAFAGNEMGKPVGQWHTPSITARALHDLINKTVSCGIRSFIAQDMQINGAELLQTLNTSPCLIWLPMRLGINELNPSYIPVVKALLSTPLAVGIGGGRPKSSYYFFGFIDNDLLYLDPHVTRAAVQAKKADELTEEDLQTYQTDSVKRMPITAIDPCFVACYLLTDVSDYESFVNFIADLKDFNGQNLISLQSPDQIDVESRIIADTDDDFLEIS